MLCSGEYVTMIRSKHHSFDLKKTLVRSERERGIRGCPRPRSARLKSGIVTPHSTWAVSIVARGRRRHRAVRIWGKSGVLEGAAGAGVRRFLAKFRRVGLTGGGEGGIRDYLKMQQNAAAHRKHLRRSGFGAPRRRMSARTTVLR